MIWIAATDDISDLIDEIQAASATGSLAAAAVSEFLDRWPSRLLADYVEVIS